MYRVGRYASTLLLLFAVVHLSREKMTSAVTADRLGEVWTPQRAVEYLLLGGLLSEAVWFVGRLGDWKTQIILSGVIHYHCENTANTTARSVMSFLLPVSYDIKTGRLMLMSLFQDKSGELVPDLARKYSFAVAIISLLIL